MTALLPLLPKCPAHSFRRSSLAPTGCSFAHQPSCFSVTLIFLFLCSENLSPMSPANILKFLPLSRLPAAVKHKSLCVSYPTCAYPKGTTPAKGWMTERMPWASMATNTTLDTELLQVFRWARFLPCTTNETLRCLW